MELLKLIECEIEHDASRRVYEVYAGEWVKIISNSANGSWHTLIEYDTSEDLRKHGIVDEATILVLSDGLYVGHWKSMTLFYEFLELYMRAKIIEEVVA